MALLRDCWHCSVTVGIQLRDSVSIQLRDSVGIQLRDSVDIAP